MEMLQTVREFRTVEVKAIWKNNMQKMHFTTTELFSGIAQIRLNL